MTQTPNETFMALDEKVAAMKLATPCCEERFVPVMESAGSYMGDEFVGLECLECTNTWNSEGELVYLSLEVTTEEGNMTFFGHPEKTKEQAVRFYELVEKGGFTAAWNAMRPF